MKGLRIPRMALLIVLFMSLNILVSCCPDGHWRSPTVLYCLPCTQCKEGYGVVVNCTSKGDTDCQPCKDGFESPGVDMTVCTATLPTTQSPASTPSTAVVVALGVLSTLAIIVSAIFVFVLWKRCCRSRRQSNTSLTEDRSHMLDVAYKRDAVGSVKIAFDSGGNSSGYDSQSSLGGDALAGPSIPFQYGVILLEDLSANAIPEIALHLNPGKRWEAVAGGLGYTSLDIANFALNRDCQYFQAVMWDFKRLEDATVGRLLRELRNIRHDVACNILMRYADEVVAAKERSHDGSNML